MLPMRPTKRQSYTAPHLPKLRWRPRDISFLSPHFGRYDATLLLLFLGTRVSDNEPI